MNVQAIDLESLVDQMTLREKVSLLSGEDFWSLPAIERLGIGKLRVTDGPNGARGSGSLVGGAKSAAFPVGIAIGASFDPELAREIGAAIAEEVKSKGAHVSLAPTVNIHRSVTNGRNFECYSEDPELTAALAVGYIEGLQSRNVASTIKHFAGNESEIERTTMSSQIDERTLREVYLRPFEDAVKKAGVWSVMSSYNRLNGTYASENGWLLTDVLRKDWGFDGVVMSDWFGTHSAAPSVNAGLNLEMPGPARTRGERLIEAVETGEVSQETLRTRVLDVLRLMHRTGSLSDRGPFVERSEDRPAHRALIRRAGAEAAVLLKNNGVLPLTPSSAKIAVIGPNAKIARIMGGGSAQLNPHYAISPWQALVDRLSESRLSYAEGCTNHRWEPVWKGDIRAEFFANKTLSGEPVHVDMLREANTFWIPPVADGRVDSDNFSARLTGTFTPEHTGRHRLGIHSAGLSKMFVDGKLVADAWNGWTRGHTFFEEGCDEVVGEIELESGRTYSIVIEFARQDGAALHLSALRAGIGRPLGDADIEAAAEAARNAETAIVFVGRSGEWDTEGSDLQGITLPGRQDDLIAAVAAANPHTVVVLQTGGPVEMPWADRVAAILQAWYPGQEAGNAIADVLFGDAEPGGRLPQTFPRSWRDNPTFSQDPEHYPGLDGKVRYREGVFIGYRHYEKLGIEPLYPFGHGLSYTTFEMGALEVTRAEHGATARVSVANTGERAGSTVVQIYAGDDEASIPRPVRELKHFAKVRLAPGESRKLTFDLPLRAFAFFDVTERLWRLEDGSFTISAGFSATDIRAEASINMPASTLDVTFR
ncbi:glycoside hydrolase family 3 protein [Rhizobium sp. L1K21]|uniref:beta-glucosidase n=1 Tax=Rhizobium sp. L1K21 TaxID=2954933 RepID=UPI0020930194|nr:glycoside hydrolase family 3 C-terminal domain-containing protein [Rhizobium sp. L1K21]MCO6188529.1 glycoside hydrolase family 3 C-terminal domain-containing protein [Rhizobium sp. L1K21]